MNSHISKIVRSVGRGFLSVALVTLLAAGASFAAAPQYYTAKRHRQDLEHYTKVGVRKAARGTGHAVMVSGRAVGHYFHRVGRAIF